MDESGEQDVAQQLQAVGNSLAPGIKAFAEAMQDPNRIGLGTSSPLEKPITDSFGTFTLKKEYETGCDIGEVLERNGGVVTFVTKDGEIIRHVEIGKTPDQYDPTKGGKLIIDAGDHREYLLAVRKKDSQNPDGNLVFRYVGSDELKGAIVKKGEATSLNPLPNENRHIGIQGVVQTVQSLKS